MLGDLREILYPGYGRRQNLHMGNVGYHVGDLIDGLHDRLTQQIARALRHDCKAKDLETDFEAEAQLIAIRLLESIPELRKTLVEDVQAAYDGDPAAKNLDEIIFCYPGVSAITVYRIAHELYRLGVPLIPRMMTEYAHGKTGIDIHPGADDRPPLLHRPRHRRRHRRDDVHRRRREDLPGRDPRRPELPARRATGEILRDTKRHPTIEDDVVIYANATILGGKTVIGHHSVIGSSAWLTRSIAPYTTVTIENPRLRYRGASDSAPGADGLGGFDYQI